MSKWIEIFRAGKHIDSNGIEHTYTDADIERTAKLYQERKVDAPLTLGHPKGNGPAYGWIGELKADSGKLLMRAKDVTDDLVSWTKKRMFKYISPSLYPDGRIRHLAFLGDTPPAIKDLPEIPVAAFAEGEEFFSFEEAPIEFEEDAVARYGIQNIGHMLGRFREWIISKFGIEEADKVIRPWEIDELKNTLVTLEPVTPSPIPAYAEGKSIEEKTNMPKPKTLEEALALIDQQETQIHTLSGQVSEFSESKTQFEQIQAQNAILLKEKEERNKKEVAEFMEGHKAIPEKFRKPLESLLIRLKADDLAIEFSEGGETKKEGAVEVLMGLFDAALVPQGEFARRQAGVISSGAPRNYTEGATVDEERDAMYQRAKAIETEKKINFSEAVMIAIREAEGGN